ncbi:uncharacterized protein FIBRA_00870 [Fibroporia radiculosa]|uniref:Uncharacterized protein n=1 Tax=Fibroporia radiculosa TaxID=599839 RepID=J4G0N3_9APHY|nr:uncharacterized protein FIBRA_00870 [Fibroporia radiculosa]CCL98863.1 predicted protein [Fibroporia radiculosa]
MIACLQQAVIDGSLRTLAPNLPKEKRARSSFTLTEDAPYWMDPMSPEAGQRALRLGRARNANQPVNRLPTEILMEVFYIVKSISRGVACPELMHVCGYWRDVALSAPLLWSAVSAGQGSSALDAYLRRSEGVPFDITYRKYVFDVRPFLDVIMPHVRRIRTLKFPALSEQAAETLLTKLRCSTPAPGLEDLTVHVTIRSSTPQIPTLWLDGATLPSLSRLSLKGILLRAAPVAFRDLVHLDLCNAFSTRPDVARIILETLGNCHRLQSLSITEQGFARSQTHRAMADKSLMVSLPSLEEFKLVASAAVISDIFTHLSLPARTYLDVGCSFDPDHITISPLAGIFPKALGSLTNLLEARSLYLFVSANIFRVRAFDAVGPVSKKILQLELNCDQPVDMTLLLPDALRDLTDTFASAPIAELELHGNLALIAEDQWRLALARLPSLECLSVGSRGQVKNILESLHYSCANAADEFLCPLLSKLHLGGAKLDESASNLLAEIVDHRGLKH